MSKFMCSVRYTQNVHYSAISSQKTVNQHMNSYGNCLLCSQAITAALTEKKRQYIGKELVDSRHQWAMYARPNRKVSSKLRHQTRVKRGIAG